MEKCFSDLVSLSKRLSAQGFMLESEHVVPGDAIDGYCTAVESLLRAILPALRRQLQAEKTDKVFQGKLPVEGSWYMVTITQPSEDTELDIMARHEKAMAYFSTKQIEVYLASLERAGCFHIHYAVCVQDIAVMKNVSRDLCRQLGVKVVNVGKKARNLQLFHGLCNYVCKRGYEDDTTHVKMLVSRIEYKDGAGWEVK